MQLIYIYLIIFKLILLFKFFFWVRCINFFLLFKNSIRLNSHFESIINSSIGPVEFINPSIFPSLFICIVFFFSFLPSLSVSFLFPFPSQYLFFSVSFSFTISLQYPLIGFLLTSLSEGSSSQKIRFPLFINFLIDSLFCFGLVVFFFNWQKYTVGLFITSWISSAVFNFYSHIAGIR